MAIAVLRSPDGRVRPGWRFLMAAGGYFLTRFIVNLLFRPVSLVSVGAAFGFVLTLAINVGIFAMLSATLDRARRPLAYIGFPREVPVVRLVAVGFTYGAAMVSIAVLLLLAGGATTFELHINGPMMRAATLQFAVFAVAALHEETLFRGYPFQRLTESIGAAPAIVAVSALFALPHLANPFSTVYAAVNTAAIGALFATAYLSTRSLWLVWGMHWGWNFVLAVAYGLNVSGFDTDGPVDGRVQGAEWLTGGAYGIEGGAVGSVAILAGYAGLLWLARQHALIGPPAPPTAAYVVSAAIPSDVPGVSS